MCDSNTLLERLMLFLKNVPTTLKESIVWFMMTYLMPIVQVFIIWGIKQSYFEWSTDIMNIVLVTNASLYTAILLLVRTTEKDKKVLNTITIFAYVLTVVLFTISMVEINLGLIVFP